ncbi:MAG: hypothetical protein JWQ65_497, partial [Devosia sp.]|nr:hypothetical protein [Devosia sp.]
IDVHRLPFPRPRQPVIDLVGEDNQGLPLLVLAGTAPDDAKAHGEVRFVSETRRILELLSERHGFPKLHS